MNIKQIFLPLIGALALIGCNKEPVEPTSSNGMHPSSVTLDLSLEGTAISTNSMRAVSFDTNEDIPPTKHETGLSNWQTHCFLRNEAGTAQAYALIDWDATVVGGRIKLKMKGHRLTLQQSGGKPLVQPRPGERWYIAGITGGGKLTNNRTRVEFKPDATLDQTLKPNQARVPFTFSWTGFTVSKVSGQVAPKLIVQFEPQGTLFNIRVKNKTAKTVNTELKIVSNALSNSGYYDYSTNLPQWFFTNATTQEEVISRRVSVTQGDGQNYVFWGMPRTSTSTVFSSRIVAQGYDISNEGPTAEKPKIRNKGFANALAYPMGIDIDRIWSPLNQLSTTGISSPIVKFARKVDGNFIDPTLLHSPSDVYNSGIYYTQEEAKVSYDYSLNRAYYLPTIWELGTIFPAQRSGGFDPQTYSFDGTDVPGAAITEIVQFEPGGENDKLKTVISSYRASGSIIYADRFKSLGGISTDNSRRTAFRYERIKIRNLGDGTALFGLKITTRYLGNSGDATNYHTEAYWTDKSRNAQDVTVIFPALGFNGQYLGISGYYWSSNVVNGKRRYVGLHTSITGFGHYPNETTSLLFPLILFPKN